MNVLLDTNACIAAIGGRPSVRQRIQDTAGDGAAICVSSITIFELWLGIGRSERVADNTDQLAAFVYRVTTLPFDDEDAKVAGLLRATLRRQGRPIGPYDLLLAGQALRHDLTIVTANVREFSRVPDLRWENWEA